MPLNLYSNNNENLFLPTIIINNPQYSVNEDAGNV